LLWVSIFIIKNYGFISFLKLFPRGRYLMRLNLLERIEISSELSFFYSPAVAFISRRDIPYLDIHQKKLVDVISKYSPSLQLKWIELIVRFILKKKLEIDCAPLIGLYSRILNSDAPFESFFRKRIIFKKILLISGGDTEPDNSVVEVIDIAFRQKFFKLIGIYNCIFKSQVFSKDIFDVLLKNISGLNKMKVHDVFYRFSPQMRMIKKILKRANSLFTDRDINSPGSALFRETIFALLPYLGNHRSGKQVLKKIFKDFNKKRADF
jgi:hypothetical protein